MQELDVENECKCIVVGNGQVGKTSMTTRFAKGIWTDSYKKTIGTDFMERDFFVKSKGETIRLMLWDTAVVGQEMFAELTRQYYQGAGAVVFVFSTVDRDSFLSIDRWVRKVAEMCPDIPRVLVQNKIDLLSEAKVDPGEVEELARKLGMKLYRVCVKDDVNVTEVFEYLCESILNKTRTVSQTTNSASVKKEPVMGAFDKPVLENNKSVVDIGGPSKQRTEGKKSLCSFF